MAPPGFADRPRMFTSFGSPGGVVDVADPYGGTERDYERALDLIESGCKGLLETLATAHWERPFEAPSSPKRFTTLNVSRETSLSYLLWGRLPQ